MRLKKRLLADDNVETTRGILQKLAMHTVCESAWCPNMNECFSQKTATFMILGNVCTRQCRFCAVGKGHPLPSDEGEPLKVALAVQKLGLKYVVITSVTRDDLPDKGVVHFIRTVEEVRKLNSETKMELLIPDFGGQKNLLLEIVNSSPEVVAHNLETVPGLYFRVRPQSNYQRSLEILKFIKQHSPSIYTKSGLMLGLGEEEKEVREVMTDLRLVGCDFLTLGQYLQPTQRHLPVIRYVTTEEFDSYRKIGLELGFSVVESGPFVRSSYKARDTFAQGKMVN